MNYVKAEIQKRIKVLQHFKFSDKYFFYFIAFSHNIFIKIYQLNIIEIATKDYKKINK